MEENTMVYFFAAFSAVWILLALYLYSIRSREKKLHADIDWLREKIGQK